MASVVSALVGDAFNALIIVVMVALSVVLNFVQTYRSHRAVERLREEVAPQATVRRDGRWTEIARRDVVPGDVIRLSAGDRVPADARLLETRDLHVQEASLTGESMPVEKPAADTVASEDGGADTRSTVFLGTSVVSGTAIALVGATGRATAFGDIAARLMERPPETEFERGIRRFAMLIMRTVVFLVLFVLLAGAVLHRPTLEILLFAVALAVGLTPEFLPMITTVTLAQGAVCMARRHVIVRHLAAIEDFGSMDVLCSDKTGTLTTGEMALDQSLDPLGRPSERAFILAWLNSRHETGIRSPLDEAILRRECRERWNIETIRNFMLVIGPISSVYDFLTFWVLLKVFAAPAALFHTGWFVESLATRTLVLFVIRTTRRPLKSRPSAWLTLTTLVVVAIGVALPYTPLASALGFVPLPGAYFAFLVAATVTYLLLVEIIKRRLPTCPAKQLIPHFRFEG